MNYVHMYIHTYAVHMIPYVVWEIPECIGVKEFCWRLYIYIYIDVTKIRCHEFTYY